VRPTTSDFAISGEAKVEITFRAFWAFVDDHDGDWHVFYRAKVINAPSTHAFAAVFAAVPLCRVDGCKVGFDGLGKMTVGAGKADAIVHGVRVRGTLTTEGSLERKTFAVRVLRGRKGIASSGRLRCSVKHRGLHQHR
jgi:hypothetical protein